MKATSIKNQACRLQALPVLLASLLIAIPLANARSIWNAMPGTAANTNWSTASNWTPDGVPGSLASVVFTNPATVANGITINNVVDAGFGGTISSLAYTHASNNSFENTLIANGVTLNLTGTGGLLVGGTNDPGVGITTTATVSGSGGTLNVNNTSASIYVAWAGANTSTATLNLTNLDTFNATFSQLQVGQNDSLQRASGVMYLARTNTITAMGTGTGTSAALVVGDTLGFGNASFLYLGRTNAIYANNIVCGLQKQNAASGIKFAPVFTNSQPVAYFRAADGVSAVANWTIGDGFNQTGSATAAGVCDFSGGTVNALVGSMNLARQSVNTTAAATLGTLTLTAGSISVNNLTNAVSTQTNVLHYPLGIINVNGTAALSVKFFYIAQTNGYAGLPGACTGVVNVASSGTLAVGNLVPGGGTSVINFGGGTLIITNNAGTPAFPITTLNLTNTALHLNLNAASNVTNVVAATLNLGTNTITIDSIAGVNGAGTTFTFPLISYGTRNMPGTFANSFTVTAPVGYSCGLSDNTSGNTVNLWITNNTVTAPAVTTQSASSTTTTSATLNGNVNNGGSSLTGYGFYWSTTLGVTTDSTKVQVGTSDLNASYTANLSSLSVNTIYYYRAYAVNSVGATLDSADVSFYTLANPPPAPTVNGATGSSLNVALGAGDGNPAGTQYVLKETTTGNYVQANGTLGAAAVYQTAATWGTVTVTGLTACSGYIFEAAAQNGTGIATAFGPTTAGSILCDAYDILRQKWKDQSTGTGYNLADTNVAAQLASLAGSANWRWSIMNTNPSGRTYLWSDAASTTDSSQISLNYSRLQIMALAYATAGCSLQGNPMLLTNIISGLDWMNANRYNTTRVEYDNWWDWQIGSPLALDNITVLLYNQLSPTQISNYMAAVDYFVTTPQQQDGYGAATAANLVWQTQVVGVRGCLVKDTNKLALASAAFSAVFPYVTNSDGFYVDGSFIQHSDHPYTAGYGNSLLASIAPMLSWLSGSSWAVTDPAQTNVYQWVFNAYAPLVYRGAAWDPVRGRETSRYTETPQSIGHDIMNSILQIAQFAPAPQAAQMKSLLKYWAQNDTVLDFVGNTPLSTLTLAEQLMADTNVIPSTEPLGHYTFGSMDRVVHLGSGYSFGLCMCSSRIANFESLNGENRKGWFTGDGMTTLYNTDLNQYGSNYWPTVDAYRLPGITADTTAVKTYSTNNPGGDLRADGYNTLSPYPWVGGASLGNYGAAGMQLQGVSVTLTAKKSWFMFGNEIVCLGAGITSSGGDTIETIVENRKLDSAGDNAFTVNGTTQSVTLGLTNILTGVNWAQLVGNVAGADIGYYFSQPATLTAVRETRTGAWSGINSGGTTALRTNNYLRFGFNHGINPTNATYQYMLLPGWSAQLVSDYAANPSILVLANDPAAQGASETQLGITAVNFWGNTTNTVGPITCHQPASVLVQNNGTFVDVAVSDPTQTNTGSINLTIAVSATALISADPGVSVTQMSTNIQMNVAVNNAAGKTFKARFYLPMPQTIPLTDVADTYSYDGTPTNNYGTNSTMAVKKWNGTGYNRLSYVRFAITNLPAGTFNSASVGLMPVYANVPGVHTIGVVNNNSWGETTLTWSNQPACGLPLATWTPATNVPVNIPVTSAVATALTGGSNAISFCLSATNVTGDGYVQYATRENTTVTNRPQLWVSFTHTPPIVTLISPTNGTLLTGSSPITLAVSAQGVDGIISNVAFYDNGVLLGTKMISPYSLTIGNLVSGSHWFTATATDSNGLTSSTVSAIVDVNNPVPTIKVSAFSVSAGIVSLTATGAVGGTYRLWASTNLAATPVTNTWTLLTNGTIAVSPFTITDPGATTNSQRFYMFSTP